VNKGFTKRIVELTKDESDTILDYLFKVGHSFPQMFRLSERLHSYTDHRSWYRKTMTTKSVSNGARMMSRFGITAPIGILLLMTTMMCVLEIVLFRLVRHRTLTRIHPRGRRRWRNGNYQSMREQQPKKRFQPCGYAILSIALTGGSQHLLLVSLSLN
jgi:hypothetical protein